MWEQSDREIIQEVLNGNKDLFAVLVARYEKPIFNYVYGLVRQRQDAEDLTQEAFVKAFFALRTYRDSFEFSTWMYRIARNVCLDYFRRQKIRSFFSLNTPVGEEEDELGDFLPEGKDPEEGVLKEELLERVSQAVGQLPLKFREVIVLRYVEELSYEEIARILDVPVGTVKTYLHRAKAKLRELLGEEFS
jgi:RNA polymerase sigma-70 factor (ECF subfamily)|uniref:RNA polymerase sigma factor n=1 Tax=Candidatus Caldatribacterium californiense TaxID=1454726 RepID=A0A7V3YFH4_9BACT